MVKQNQYDYEAFQILFSHCCFDEQFHLQKEILNRQLFLLVLISLNHLDRKLHKLPLPLKWKFILSKISLLPKNFLTDLASTEYSLIKYHQFTYECFVPVFNCINIYSARQFIITVVSSIPSNNFSCGNLYTRRVN